MFTALRNFGKSKIGQVSKCFGIDANYFLRNGCWVVLRQGAGAILGIMLAAVFARLASQEAYGKYQFVMSVLGTMSLLAIPGLNNSIVRTVARGYDGDYRKAVKTSWRWSLLGIPCLLALGAYYYLIKDQELGIALMLSSVFFPLFYAPNTWDSFLQGKQRQDIATKFTVIQLLFNTGITMAAILFKGNSAIWIVSASLASYSGVNIWAYFRSLNLIGNYQSEGDAIQYGFRLTKLQVLLTVAENADKLLVGILLSPTVLAAYNVASMIPIKLRSAVKPLASSLLFPKMSRHEGTLVSLIHQKKKLLYFGLAVSLFLGAAYFFLVVPINRILFGTGYRDYYTYSLYFVFSVLLVMPLSILGYYNQAKRYYRVLLATHVLFPIAQIAIDFLLIKFMGLLGAVLAYNINLGLWFLVHVIGIMLSEKQIISRRQ